MNRCTKIPFPFHNGSIFRESVPLRNSIFPVTPATALLRSIARPSPFYNGSKIRIFLPLRKYLMKTGADNTKLECEESAARNEKSGGERCPCRILQCLYERISVPLRRRPCRP